MYTRQHPGHLWALDLEKGGEEALDIQQSAVCARGLGEQEPHAVAQGLGRAAPAEVLGFSTGLSQWASPPHCPDGLIFISV